MTIHRVRFACRGRFNDKYFMQPTSAIKCVKDHVLTVGLTGAILTYDGTETRLMTLGDGVTKVFITPVEVRE